MQKQQRKCRQNPTTILVVSADSGDRKSNTTTNEKSNGNSNEQRPQGQRNQQYDEENDGEKYAEPGLPKWPCVLTTLFSIVWCVEQIVRMYKRMAEAGFLAKEPGMGAADITKAHGR